jgi:hypothetical protein
MHTPLEPHVAVAEATKDAVTIHSSTQTSDRRMPARDEHRGEPSTQVH